MADAALFLRDGIRDDAARIHFRTGAGSGRDGHDGDRRGSDLLPSALALLDVVPDVAVICGAERNRLGAVHHGAAAQTNHEVAAFLPGAVGAGHDGGRERIGFDDGEMHPFNLLRI